MIDPQYRLANADESSHNRSEISWHVHTYTTIPMETNDCQRNRELFGLCNIVLSLDNIEEFKVVPYRSSDTSSPVHVADIRDS
jgi:hypothetical protein